MIPSGSCAVLLAIHPQGVSDGYGRIMVGFIVVGMARPFQDRFSGSRWWGRGRDVAI
jgi:hypothetical protein